MDEASGSRQCLVCTVPITSIHLGMDTCRACAAFFKRAKTAGREYPCTQADRECAIKNGKFTCRRCRFNKCIAIGMEYDGPLRLRRKPTVPILQRVKQESKAFVERRREQELKIIRSHGGHKLLPHSTEELYGVHIDTFPEIYRIFLAESYTFFNNVFPAFSVLNERDQELIFKDYIGKMSLSEGYHRTRQIWGEQTQYMMCSVMTCYDIDHHYEVIEDLENASFLVGFTHAYVEEQKEIFLPLYNRCAFTEREHHALMALVISEVDSTFDISEEAQVILDRYRQEVLEELQSHYQDELGLKDFSTRLGNLMSLNHIIQECKSLFKVFFRCYATLFDVFITDKLMTDLILC
ncbi:hypothetical protein PENTCL1PPCAC_15447 [Pristionchus entomophagus]|uniref:Nuclear receptor domain-containing protein n=1 Tax=Pristionchus entomophagus TaxID=358040 RepID=A0AAV5TF08_9BILA|nr:hypothetical protein PENTCL1PPCAC_15447 [Pristionchus entomophagus]